MKSKQVGNYQLKEVIGEGSFGKVYRAIDMITMQQMALKFISRKGKSKKDIDKQKEEIEILKKLKHDHIIYLKQFIETQDELIVVTEFAGKDLAAVLQKQKKLSLDQIRNYAGQILSALLYLHENRIVHRDLKPQNILIKDGKAKLCDFGFARKMSAATVCLYSLKGTPLYIAPQIISDKPYNHKIDIWSLGIILYQLFCGQPPFYADSYYKLLPKILHDKVKYPKDIDLSLKQLIEGMLQKSPSLRYDYSQITSHPFLQQKSYSALKQNKIDYNVNQNITQNIGQNLGRIQQQDEFDKSFRTQRNPSKLRPNKHKLNAQQLKGYEQDIKLMRPSAKTLKTDLLFYNRLVSLFALYTLDNQITKQCLYSAVRVIIGLITKVRLESDIQKQSDITKKNELLTSVIKLIQQVDDEGLVAQCYNAICYLLKSNFNLNEINMDAAQFIITSSVNLLRKPKISSILFTNLLYVIGTLSAQALAITSPQQFYKVVIQEKILMLIPNKMTVESSTVVFQCLKRFVHPVKGDFKLAKGTRILKQLKQHIASGFSQHTFSLFPKISDNAAASQAMTLYSVIYECVKASSEFRKLFISNKSISSIKSQLYSLAISYYINKYEGSYFCDIQKIRASIIHSNDIASPITSALQLNIFSKYLIKYQNKQASQYLSLLWKRLNKLLELPQYHKTKQIEYLQGWAFGQPTLKFNDIIVESFLSLFDGCKSDSLFVSSGLNHFFETILKGSELNISIEIFCKLLGAIKYLSKGGNIDKKLISQVYNILLISLNNKQITIIKDNYNADFMKIYIKQILQLLKQIGSKDENKLSQFYSKCEGISFHQTIINVIDDQRMVLLALPILSRILSQKCHHSTVQDIVLLLLPKIKRFYSSCDASVIIQIIQILAILSRIDVNFYPSIAHTSLCEYLPQYLSHSNQIIKQKTINLVGNLAKHSKFFFADFDKYKIIYYINGCLSKPSNFERMIKNIVYAIGNISFYSDQFQSEIKPLVPYFAACLELQNDHLIQNTVSTLSNLVRHSNIYVKQIISSGIFKRVLELASLQKNVKLTQFCLNFVLKAVQHEQIVHVYRESISKVIRNIKDKDNDIIKRIAKIQQKLY